MASGDAEIVMHSKLNKKIPKKPPKSPTADILKGTEKRTSTKEMVNKALTELNTRKGTSLYAIKKYIEDTYHIDTEKIGYIIKKYLKTAVEAGTIVQTKGTGASGSFKLADKKMKMEKKKEIKKIAKKITKTDKEDAKTEDKKAKAKKKKDDKKPEKEKREKKETKTVAKKVDKKEKVKKSAEDKKVKEVKVKEAKPASVKEKKEKKEKKSKAMMALAQTPAKKRAAMMKRKSMGSIIKPPKMKPKATNN